MENNMDHLFPILLLIATFLSMVTFAVLRTRGGDRFGGNIFFFLALVALIAIPAAAGGDLRTTPNDTTALHTKLVKVPEQPVATANAFRTSTAIDTLSVGSVISPSTASVPGVAGRNVTITQTNAGGATNPVVTYRVRCFDQFGYRWSEDITANNTTIAVGTKVCQTFVDATITARAGVEASDTVIMGTGNVVGLPFQFSKDLREIEGLEREASLIQKRTVTVGHADLTASALTQAINIGAVLPANARIVGVDIHTLTVFSGGGASAVSVDIGTSGDVDALVDGSNLFAAAVDGGPSTMPLGIRHNKLFATAGAQLIATFISDVNVVDLTAGAVTIDVLFVGDSGTASAITVNTTNLDTVNYACKATCFSSSTVANGDTLTVLLRTDDQTQDNKNYPAR